MIAMALPTDRKLISTSEAAKILGVSMGRVRQLALAGSKSGGLDSWHAAPTALVFDEAQVKNLAKKTGTTGRPRGGFRQN